MSDDAVDTISYRVGSGVGTRFTDEARELAYQLWAFTLGGNCVKVAQALAQLSTPIEVDPRSVQRWAESEQWAVRRADDWQHIAPDLARQTTIDVRYGLLETARMARDLVTNDRTRTVTTITPNGSVRTQEVPEISSRDRIAAGLLLEKIASSLPPTSDASLPRIEPSSPSPTNGTSDPADSPPNPANPGSVPSSPSRLRDILLARERERRHRRTRHD